ncbi:MAG TPA: hypothetical protein VIK81_03850 [Patescibacteria group bacterium]
MKKASLIFAWLFIAPLTLIIALLASNQTFDTNPNVSKVKGISINSVLPYKLYTAVPGQVGAQSAQVYSADARGEILKQFLEDINSPLALYSDFIVEMSDKYQIDFRLITAISMQESSGGKVIPSDSYNAWGFENGATEFSSWEHAIERVAKTLKEGYYDKGLVTPEQIMPKYAPPSVEKGGPWAKGVQYFMDVLE